MLHETLANAVVPLVGAVVMCLAAPGARAKTKPPPWKVLPARSGPVVTDAEFFAALDLGRPGLEAVRAAVDKGDMPAAKTALVAYFKTRAHPIDPQAPIRPVRKDPTFDTSRADSLVRGRFSHWLYPDTVVDFSKGTDWTFLPVNDREWAWVLSRHHQWVDLANAYLSTGDEKYARAYNDDLSNWVRFAAVPPKSAGSDTPVWRTIEAGIRLGQTWLPAYHAFLASPSFAEEGRILFYKSILEHARFLRANPGGGNWLTMEMNGLAHAAVMFPEFREAAEWREFALTRLAKELNEQVYPDGAQFELTTSYHNVALANFLAPMKLAEANRIPLPEGYRRDIEKMFVFDLFMAKPNGALPAFNDSDPGLGPRDKTPASAFLREGADLFRREDFRYVGTNGAQGTPPAEASHAFPYAGLFVMRSGWDKDARYLALDAGPFGAGHQHEDKLSFELAAYDRTFLVDPGRGAYASSPYRSFFVGTSSHNTLMVDGLGQNRRARGAKHPNVVAEPLPHAWLSSPGADFVEGVYDEGYGADRLPVRHQRRILFVKPGYWLVADRLDGDGTHIIESLLHFDEGTVEERTGTGEVRTVNDGGPNLSIRPLADGALKVSVVAGREDPVQGWIAPDYDTRVPAPVAIFEATASLPFGMGLVLCPAPAGKQPPAATRVDVLEAGRRLPASDAIACRVTDGPDTDDVYLCNASPDRRAFAGHMTDGMAAIVRRARGRLVGATLVQGRALAVAGTPVITLDTPADIVDIAWEGDTVRVTAPGATGIIAARGAKAIVLNGASSAIPSGKGSVHISEGKVSTQ